MDGKEMPTFVPWTTGAAQTDTGEAQRGGAPVTVPERIEALIQRTGLSYYDLAKFMGVTRTTVHDVRHGKRNPTKKFIAKLDLAEKRIDAARRGEGILTRKGDALLVFAMNTATVEDAILSTPDVIQVKLLPTSGEAEPPGIEVKLVKPQKQEAMGALLRALTQEKCDELILSCLRGEHASQNFVEKMSPASYMTALKRCTQLILGPAWKQELQALAEDVEERRARMLKVLYPEKEPEPPKAPEPKREPSHGWEMGR